LAESLSLPLSILQIHAHRRVLCLAATQDESVNSSSRKQARRCLEENGEHYLQKGQVITLLTYEKAITSEF
jgi:hypothetical protein